MGWIYAREIFGVSNPSLGLLSNGQELIKGNKLTKTTHALLVGVKFSGYQGYIEGNQIFQGKVDVVICDGFVGNIALKVAEDAAVFVEDMIKNNIHGPRAKLGAWLLKPVFKRVKAIIDPSQYGGALLLGVNGIVIIAHGNSDAEAIRNALKVAERAYKNKLTEKLEGGLQKLII